jgi:fructose-1,6-bisphosphatase/inositol monophosphatase family enzyme
VILQRPGWQALLQVFEQRPTKQIDQQANRIAPQELESKRRGGTTMAEGSGTVAQKPGVWSGDSLTVRFCGSLVPFMRCRTEEFLVFLNDIA